MINVSLFQTLVFTIIQNLCKNIKFEISPPTWNEESELPDESYSVSNTQDYFGYILKKHWESIDNPSVRIYVNKKENRFIFRIKTGYYLEVLTSEIMKLLGRTKKITKDRNGANVPNLEITGVVLVHFNISNNDYQQDSRVFYILFPNKSLDKLVNISPKNFILLKHLIQNIHILKYGLLIKILKL